MRLWRRIIALVTLAATPWVATSDRLAVRCGSADGAAGPPSDWFGLQRAYPFASINQQAYAAALEQARFERAQREFGAEAAGTLMWQAAGPFNVGGRVTALAAVPGGGVLYLGSANGGVFKSVNNGIDFTPVFDAAGSCSIGSLALDPVSPSVVYAGTGESNGSADSYDGTGVYRSEDAGATWSPIGLAATGRIARIAIDPQNTNRILVAAMGTQFSTGPDRGIFRSEDRGVTWTRVLFVSDSTGACDVVFNPMHPETVFCATWERVRRYTYRRTYGPECGIWRSVNHGTTWARLTNGLPSPSDNVGRIGLAIPRSRPSTVYAQIMAGPAGFFMGLGFYRSLNGGDTWTRRDAGSIFVNAFGNFGWYFGDAVADPVNPDVVYALGLSMIRSSDGGANWQDISTTHADHHALWVDPLNPSHLDAGCDGGFFTSTSAGPPWTRSVDLPITQFYAGTVDPSNSLRLMGGSQDNGVNLTAGSPSGWNEILGGDGCMCVIDPTNPNVLLAEFERGSEGSGPHRSVNGGGLFTPPTGISSADRFNWCAPIVMSPNDHNVVLTGSDRVYKSTNNGASYSAVSADLTLNPSPPAPLPFNTVSALEVSPADGDIYYAGTDDGRVWRSLNAGASWTNISAGLPVRSVTRLTADPVAANVVYVTLSGFGQDEHLPHVYRSTDQGATWASIAANLPDAPANDIVVDPSIPQTLYLATDVGVYATRNLGGSWFPLGTGMPVETVLDLTLHQPSRTLVAITHGRGMWKLDLSAMPVAVTGTEPELLRLSAPAPNPSRGSVSLALELASSLAARVAIYDVQGRLVRTLLDGTAAGAHTLTWDGRDASGRRTGAGVYFVRASAAGVRRVQRLVRTQ